MRNSSIRFDEPRGIVNPRPQMLGLLGHFYNSDSSALGNSQWPCRSYGTIFSRGKYRCPLTVSYGIDPPRLQKYGERRKSLNPLGIARLALPDTVLRSIHRYQILDGVFNNCCTLICDLKSFLGVNTLQRRIFVQSICRPSP